LIDDAVKVYAYYNLKWDVTLISETGDVITSTFPSARGIHSSSIGFRFSSLSLSLPRTLACSTLQVYSNLLRRSRRLAQKKAL
jgi:hypothetical protein